MSACDGYFGKVFAHLAGAMAVSAVSSQTLDLTPYLVNDSKLLSVILQLAIMFGLLFAVFITTPGSPLKYLAFGAFAVFFGQIFKPYISNLQDRGLLTRVLVQTTGVFVGMMAVGFYDNQNLLGFGPYLFAGLVGLLVARLLLLAFGSPEEKKQGSKFLDMFAVALFAVFTAWDVQFLKASAKFCKRMLRNKIQPDYPKESLGLYLDFLNLFAAMGGSGE
jgi:FtsH-binding integral membrane protein